MAHRLRFPHAVGLAGAAAALMVTLGLSSDLARPAEAPPADAAEVVAIGSASPAIVDRSLVGTGALPTPGVTAAACPGAALPLSLPAGSTPTGATLVRAVGAGNQPGNVDPATAAGWATVPSGDTVLVGDQAACVSDLITPLDGAPDDTALAVSYLDRLGQLQVLVVPRVVTVVQDAVTAVADLAVALDVQTYLRALEAALAEAADDAADGVGGGAGPDGSGLPGDPSVPDIPSGGVPDLPALPPAVDDTVDGVVDGVGDTVDGVVGGLGDTVDDLLG